MAQSTRFGRRLPLPSTRQIRHELLVFTLAEGALSGSVEQPQTSSTNTNVASDVIQPAAPPVM
ncbi:hypothetical protein LGH83_05455 [Lichenihabitans sp. PAMC28606]|uniref:hypothetical protein n=1 Tax=Lichenihabitans sp. PAMC28606 TaxID=2880932 RepID=UPI001D0BBB34|nr:hypothetical protein [Lichenihabitans sp. PAMC28606]UDL95660.1 hypothetical protein LGH83_05455 [Lichenihabitans sp. PAMC28606]